MISPWINPGKIHYKFGQAGADGVVLVGSGQIGYLGKNGRNGTPWPWTGLNNPFSPTGI